MKKLLCFCSLLMLGSFANAAEMTVQRGMCTGLTTSGKTVVLTFCAPSTGESRLVACTPQGRGRVNLWVDVTYPDKSTDSSSIRAKHSKILNNKEDAFEAQAYSVTRRELNEGAQGYSWASVNAIANGPSAFTVDFGPGFWFEFHNAECHFSPLEQQ